MPELTAEAVIHRHPRTFDEEVVVGDDLAFLRRAAIHSLIEFEGGGGL
jgi:hypothetical protein